MDENRDNAKELAVQPENHSDSPEWYETVSFRDAKVIIRSNLATAARSFIAIGYYLKHIRDQELYREDGFDSIWEFAQTEYGISKSTASRYMAMNDRFSEGGNSPMIQEKYKQFNKSQLQEMLSLDHDQLEQVTPADRVEDIRAMRKPKEIPYVELPGQISIADFPGIDPEELAAADDGLSGQEEEETVALPQSYTLTVDQLIGEDKEGDKEESIAIPQQEPSGWCLYRPGFQCTLPEADKRTPGDGEDCTRKCCWDCTKHGRCRIECYASAQRPEGGKPEAVAISQQEGHCENGSGCLENAVEPAEEPVSAYGTPKRIYPPDSLIAIEGCEGGHDCFSCAMNCQIRGEERYCREAPLGKPFPCEIVKGDFEELPESCQFVDHDLAYHRTGDGEPNPCCKNCQKPCEYICGRAMKTLDQQTEKLTEGEERLEQLGAEESEQSDIDLLRKMLEKENKDLSEAIKINKIEPHPDWEKMIRRRKLLVGALAGMLCDMENMATADESPEQPDLPILKNNDQRRDWLNTFHDWPVWFEVPQAAEVYYRYDLPDGYSLVICEYHYWVSWRIKFKYDGDGPECTGTREYILTPEYHYLEDCKSNRSSMSEKLKEIQKAGGRNAEK